MQTAADEVIGNHKVLGSRLKIITFGMRAARPLREGLHGPVERIKFEEARTCAIPISPFRRPGRRPGSNVLVVVNSGMIT